MKKFLSLVLALVMTMSLVTISAGATEYKDFTDKSEIKYEEAVTVLNKLGIITGYSEGDFRPEGELTRGAAAKIIVSLLIGPEAAEALGNESSPYPDVPAGNNFAGVISFCKTSEIINGYGDGTFRPQGTLTGYAFAKMLLGALGYDGKSEGFSGPGWNMKVAKLGGEAGLFDRISFNGNATVTREQACQLALNTLKATMVEYSGGMNITTGDTNMVVNATRNYKTSNQEYAQHINNRKAGNQQSSDETWFTVEFGEEHFVDLRMEREQTNADAFGRPANVWSWKKVTIGTFPIEADYVFDHQLTHKDATNAAKNRATGLGGFKVTRTTEGSSDLLGGQTETRVWVNGRLMNDGGKDTGAVYFKDGIPNAAGTHNPNSNSGTGITPMSVENIADLTDNGTIVEVYVSDVVADFITDIVVVKTQLMEVRRVGSDYVALQKEDNKDVDSMVADAKAFNQEAIDVTVENILAEDDLYSVVSGLKAGDLVAVVPVAQETTGTTKWDVGDVYIPETVTGALSAVNYFGISGQPGTSVKQGAVDVTVGGTKYNIALWARDLYNVDGEAVKVTRKDVTLWLDRNGNALKSKDIGDASDWFVVGRYYSTMVNNRIVTMVEGWDANGNELQLNLGTKADDTNKTYREGDLVRYTTSTSDNADWKLVSTRTAYLNNNHDVKISDVYLNLQGEGGTYKGDPDAGAAIGDLYVHKDIKFIFVTFDEDSGDVDSIEIKDGVQEVTANELNDARYVNHSAQAGFDYKKDTTTPDAIKVVVIKSESNDAVASNMMYIRTQIGGAIKDANGNMVYHYTAAKMSTNGMEEEVHVYTDDKVDVNTFVAYTEKEHSEYSPFYDLRSHNNYTRRATSTFQANLGSVVNSNNGLIRIAPDTDAAKWTDDNKVEHSWASVKPVLGTQKDYATMVAAKALAPIILLDPRDNSTSHEGGESRTIRIRNAEFLDLRTTAQITASREINSLDDFNWVVKNCLDKNGTAGKSTADNGYLEQGEKTLVMQLILNDKEDANGFRTVAMVVITGEADVTAKTADNAPDTRSTATSVTVRTNKGTATYDEATKTWNVAIPAADLNDARLSVEVGPSTISAATITDTSSFGGTGLAGAFDLTSASGYTKTATTAPAAGSFTVSVTPEKSDEAPTTYTVTVTVGAAVSDKWTNPVTGDYKDVTNYDLLTNVEEVEKENISDTGSTLRGASILNTGDPAEVKEQVDSLFNFYFGAANVKSSQINANTQKIRYTVNTAAAGEEEWLEQYEYNYSSDPVLVYAASSLLAGNAEPVILAHDATITNGSSTTDGAAIWLTDDVGDGVKVESNAATPVVTRVAKGTGTDGSEKVEVVAGYTYTAKAYVKVTKGTVNDTDNSGLSSDAYKLNDEDVADIETVLVGAGDVIEITLTASAEINLAVATPLKVVFESGWADVLCSKAAVLDTSATSGNTITFVTTTGAKLATTDTITAEYTVTSEDVVIDTGVALPDITVTGPKN